MSGLADILRNIQAGTPYGEETTVGGEPYQRTVTPYQVEKANQAADAVDALTGKIRSMGTPNFRSALDNIETGAVYGMDENGDEKIVNEDQAAKAKKLAKYLDKKTTTSDYDKQIQEALNDPALDTVNTGYVMAGPAMYDSPENRQKEYANRAGIDTSVDKTPGGMDELIRNSFGKKQKETYDPNWFDGKYETYEAFRQFATPEEWQYAMNLTPYWRRLYQDAGLDISNLDAITEWLEEHSYDPDSIYSINPENPETFEVLRYAGQEPGAFDAMLQSLDYDLGDMTPEEFRLLTNLMRGNLGDDWTSTDKLNEMLEATNRSYRIGKRKDEAGNPRSTVISPSDDNALTDYGLNTPEDIEYIKLINSMLNKNAEDPTYGLYLTANNQRK